MSMSTCNVFTEDVAILLLWVIYPLVRIAEIDCALLHVTIRTIVDCCSFHYHLLSLSSFCSQSTVCSEWYKCTKRSRNVSEKHTPNKRLKVWFFLSWLLTIVRSIVLWRAAPGRHHCTTKSVLLTPVLDLSYQSLRRQLSLTFKWDINLLWRNILCASLSVAFSGVLLIAGAL